MALNKKFFFLILSISLIICQDTNKSKQTPGVEEPKEEKEKSKVEIKETIANTTKEKNDTQSQRQKRKREQSKIPYNMTIDEMDTMILCSAVVQQTIKDKQSEIENFKKELNVSFINPIYEKVGTDIFEKCTKNLDIKIVNMFMKNLTFHNNFKWIKEFDEISKIDFDKYKNKNYSDFSLTMEQQILMYKYRRVDDLFRQKRADERDNIDKENQKIKIGQLDMDSIPTSVKFLVFLAILVIFFGGVFYLLKTLEKKPKDKKKKEKKKKII